MRFFAVAMLEGAAWTHGSHFIGQVKSWGAQVLQVWYALQWRLRCDVHVQLYFVLFCAWDACMQVCMYTCMHKSYAYAYVYEYGRAYAYMYICMSACMCLCVSVCTCLHAYACVCVMHCVCMYVCMWARSFSLKSFFPFP